jgi:hypothetical protein
MYRLECELLMLSILAPAFSDDVVITILGNTGVPVVPGGAPGENDDDDDDDDNDIDEDNDSRCIHGDDSNVEYE